MVRRRVIFDKETGRTRPAGSVTDRSGKIRRGTSAEAEAEVRSRIGSGKVVSDARQNLKQVSEDHSDVRREVNKLEDRQLRLSRDNKRLNDRDQATLARARVNLRAVENKLVIANNNLRAATGRGGGVTKFETAGGRVGSAGPRVSKIVSEPTVSSVDRSAPVVFSRREAFASGGNVSVNRNFDKQQEVIRNKNGDRTRISNGRDFISDSRNSSLELGQNQASTKEVLKEGVKGVPSRVKGFITGNVKGASKSFESQAVPFFSLGKKTEVAFQLAPFFSPRIRRKEDRFDIRDLPKDKDFQTFAITSTAVAGTSLLPGVGKKVLGVGITGKGFFGIGKGVTKKEPELVTEGILELGAGFSIAKGGKATQASRVTSRLNKQRPPNIRGEQFFSKENVKFTQRGSRTVKTPKGEVTQTESFPNTFFNVEKLRPTVAVAKGSNKLGTSVRAVNFKGRQFSTVKSPGFFSDRFVVTRTTPKGSSVSRVIKVSKITGREKVLAKNLKSRSDPLFKFSEDLVDIKGQKRFVSFDEFRSESTAGIKAQKIIPLGDSKFIPVGGSKAFARQGLSVKTVQPRLNIKTEGLTLDLTSKPAVLKPTSALVDIGKTKFKFVDSPVKPKNAFLEVTKTGVNSRTPTISRTTQRTSLKQTFKVDFLKKNEFDNFLPKGKGPSVSPPGNNELIGFLNSKPQKSFVGGAEQVSVKAKVVSVTRPSRRVATSGLKFSNPFVKTTPPVPFVEAASASAGVNLFSSKESDSLSPNVSLAPKSSLNTALFKSGVSVSPVTSVTPLSGLETKPSQRVRPVSRSRFAVRPDRIVRRDNVIKVFSKVAGRSKLAQRNIQKTVSLSKRVQKSVLRNPVPGPSGFIGRPTPVLSRPIITPSNLLFPERKRSKTSRNKRIIRNVQPKGFAPSLVSRAFNITGPRSKASEFTGIGIRPIPSKVKGKKKKKKKSVNGFFGGNKNGFF